jgi:intracellular septation protein
MLAELIKSSHNMLMHNQSEPPKWLRPAVEYGPLIVFFATNYFAGLMAATIGVMIASAVALALSFIIERRLPVMPLITALIIGIFGGLTLWLQDETFIKMKPTIIQTLFGLVLLGGMLAGKLFLKSLMGAVWHMTDSGWRIFTIRFSLFFFAMAILNEAVWRTQSTDFWVSFKVFGLTGLTMVFVMTQIGLVKRHEITE